VTCIRLSLDIYMIRSFCHKIEGICLLYCRLYSDSLRLLSMKSRSNCSNFAFRFSRYRLLYSAFFCFLILSIIFRLLLLSYIVSIVVVCHNRITRRKCVTVVWAQLISLPSRRMYHIPLPYPSSAFHAHTHMYRQRMLRWRHGFFLKMVFSRSTLSLDIYMSTGLCIRLVHISTSLGLSLCPCKDLFFVTAPLRALLFPCSQWLRQD